MLNPLLCLPVLVVVYIQKLLMLALTLLEKWKQVFLKMIHVILQPLQIMWVIM